MRLGSSLWNLLVLKTGLLNFVSNLISLPNNGKTKFSNLLDLTFARVFGKFRVKYIVGVVNNVPDAEVSVEGTAKSHIISKYEQSVQQPGNPFHKIEYGDIDPQLNPKYTFENYCDSMSNKLAVSIGKAIATDPRCKTFNPLFVFGSDGCGQDAPDRSDRNKDKGNQSA